jgi:C4-dicarboxylate-specific signal transduction histidine kinase
MDDASGRFWQEQNLAFFGAVSASLSHEINNVFSIINELAGLLDDHLLRLDQHMPLDPQKLKDISGKISRQVKRGEALIKLLNRFAHSADHWHAEVGVREVLERIVAISQRFATLSKAGIQTSFPADELIMRTSPFLLQQAVFRCIRMELAAVDARRSITVRLERTSAAGALICIESADPVPQTPERDADAAFLRQCIGELGGTIEFLPAEGAPIESVRFVLPGAPGS